MDPAREALGPAVEPDEWVSYRRRTLGPGVRVSNRRQGDDGPKMTKSCHRQLRNCEVEVLLAPD